MRIARNHLEALARGDVAGLARRLGTTREEIEGARGLLRTLNPRPGAGHAGTPIVYVTPDLRVFRAAEGWQVELNAGANPRLRIDPGYAKLVRQGGPGAGARPFGSTSPRRDGSSGVSRTAPGRSVGCPRARSTPVGVPRTRRGADAALGAARGRIRARLARIDRVPGRQPEIRRDPPRRVRAQVLLLEPGLDRGGRRRLRRRRPGPTSEDHRGGGARAARSDLRLALELDRAGFRVARRTVAKYRESMGIPPSNERRRTGAVHLNVSA